MTVNRNRHIIPGNWPYRELSQFVDSGRLSWHIQLHRPSNDASLNIILLHGTGASTHSWAGLIPTLKEFAGVVNLDLPGHAFTEGAHISALNLPDMADQLHQLLLTLRLRGPVAVVGHSAGAPLAIEWALNHVQRKELPFELRQIIGLNPSLVPPPSLYTNMLGPLVAPIATSSAVTGVLSSIAARSGMVNQLLESTQSQVPEHQRAFYRYLFSQPAHVRGAMGFMAGADLPGLLQRGWHLVDIPISFLVGKQDSWVKEAPLKSVIAASFPTATVITWNGGHLIHEEEPERVGRLIQSILT
jgi:magnesium chelatase accessory protein